MYHRHWHLTETNKGRAKVKKKMVSYLQVKMLIYTCNFASYHPFPGFSPVNFTIKHKKHHLSRLDRKNKFLLSIFYHTSRNLETRPGYYYFANLISNFYLQFRTDKILLFQLSFSRIAILPLSAIVSTKYF